MQAIGFRHFAKQSPNHLALAAPDGRHWSRGELLAECDRLVMNQSGSSPRQHASTGASLPNSAGLVAIALAFQIESPEQSMIDPPQALEKARARMLPLGIQPDTLNVHYCVSPGSDTVTAWTGHWPRCTSVTRLCWPTNGMLCTCCGTSSVTALLHFT
jgi:hypothetical protein